MMRKIFIAFIILSYFFINGQNTPDYKNYYFNNFPKSPTTSEFLKYGELYNNEYMGANSPTIPLYSVESGKIKLPIEMKYIMGNGVKVADESGNLGLGWLIGLPTITQNVFGFDDFNTNIKKFKIDLHNQSDAPFVMLNYDGKYIPNKEEAEPSNYINSPIRGKFSYYWAVRDVYPRDGQFIGLTGGVNEIDASTDYFKVNLFGTTIEFIISNFDKLTNETVSPNFEVLNQKGYKIKYTRTNLFEITSPDGTIYEFSKYEETKTLGTGVTGRNYMLTRITDINNHIINLSYQQVSNIINFIPNSGNLNYTIGYTSNSASCYGIPIFFGGQWVYSSGNYSFSETNGATGSLFPFSLNQVKGSYFKTTSNQSSQSNVQLISKIDGDFGELNFNYSSRLDSDNLKLDEVYVKDYNGKQILNYNFGYDYFVPIVSINNDKLDKRLKLLYVIKNGNEKYEFEYSTIALPPKNSYAVDYWGYYNGGNSNVSYFLNPTDFNLSLPVDNNYNNNFKKANLSYADAGVLKKIYFPTKGYSEYEYELNSANNMFYFQAFSNIIKEGKGLRLKSQKNYDSNKVLLKHTKFTYENGNNTNPLDIYQSIHYNTLHKGAGGNSLDDDYKGISISPFNTYYSSPLSSGDYIGYKRVTKEDIDISGQNVLKGKIISDYANNPDNFYRYFDNQDRTFLPTTKSLVGEDNGMLLKQVFLKNSDTLKIIKNEYETKFSNTYYGTSLSRNIKFLSVCMGLVNGGSSATSGSPDTSLIEPLSVVGHFSIFSKKSILKKSEIKDFFSTGNLITTKNYTYDQDENLSVENTVFPDGSIRDKKYKYASDLYKTNLLNKNILNIPINILETSPNGFYKSILTNYDDQNSINPTSITISPVLNNSNSSFTVVTYDKYDGDNLLQFTPKSGIPTTIIWGYNKTMPILKIIGAKYDDIKANQKIIDVITASNDDIDSNSENLLRSKIDSLKNDSTMSNFIITSYTYNPLIGVTTIIQPNGEREFYKYDSNNRLQSVLDYDGRILKEYNYNFKTPFYNLAKIQSFTRNNCGSGYTAGSYTYTVPAGKYSSMISQSDADNQAQEEVNLNGQNFANNYGLCIGSCSVTFNSSLGINGGGGVYYQSGYNFSFGFSSGANSINLPWTTTGVKVATLNGTCKPSTEFSSYNGQVYYTIKTNGDVILRTHSILPNNTSYNYVIYFP